MSKKRYNPSMAQKKRSVIVFVLLFVEVIVLVALFIIIKKKTETKEVVSVTHIKKESVNFPRRVPTPLMNFYEPKPNIIDFGDENWLTFTPQYTINKDSLNEVQNYSVKKASDTFRIVTIGDSFTFGQFVNTKDNWTEQLEVSLNEKCTDMTYEVINLGVHGYDLAFSEYRYETRGEKYNPDLLIYLLKEDDFNEIKSITARAKWNFINDFKNDPNNIDALKSKTIDIELLRMAVAEGDKVLRKYYSESEVVDYQLSYLQKLIKMERNLLIFNTFTYPPEIEKKIAGMVKGVQQVTFEAKKLQIPELEKPPYNYLPYDSHATVAGNKLIKERLMNYLIKKNLIPCKKK